MLQHHIVAILAIPMRFMVQQLEANNSLHTDPKNLCFEFSLIVQGLAGFPTKMCQKL